MTSARTRQELIWINIRVRSFVRFGRSAQKKSQGERSAGAMREINVKTRARNDDDRTIVRYL